MSRPIIEIEDKQPDEKIALGLRPEVARSLRAYSEYAHGSSINHIITAALRRLFDADKGFKSYLSEHPEAGSSKGERTRRRKSPREVQKISATA